MSGEARACLACGIRVSWISLLVSLALAGMKCGIGIMAGSRALVACALYSLNDALSAAVALISLRLARRPADHRPAEADPKAEFVAVRPQAEKHAQAGGV
jgi:predicted Co/Zn/Cd cation transporter (cation efflux family)